ncbi:uncharacterized protein LOC115446798 [Manduca sexta]|uniref:uncharacterized protein LOC115446798 n=1 Tax=Manduca sexta TaxID=7130 RepID=UPI00189042BE|nr:uncharacterized protein LOC115446798 [Manduca sexta]
MAANKLSDTNETISIQYKINMINYYSKESFSGPWTRKWVRDIKYMLTSVPKLSLSKVGLYHKFVKDKFEIRGVYEGSHLYRVLKTSEEEISLPVLPFEDAFDTIWQAHLACDHGNVTEIMKLLKKSYFIDIACVREVVNVCPVCTKKNTSDDALKTVFNERAQIVFLDMTSTPDGFYKYILIYIDEATGLTQLRAVTNLASTEIAMKLLNIFTDIGPPKILNIADSVVDYIRVMDIINIILHPCDVTLEAKVQYNRRADEINKLVTEWMVNEGSAHWEIGCYVVQWKINNTIGKEKTPHQLVFENYNFIESEMVNTEIGPENSGPSGATDLLTLNTLQSETVHSEIVPEESGPSQATGLSTLNSLKSETGHSEIVPKVIGPSRATDLPSLDSLVRIDLYIEPDTPTSIPDQTYENIFDSEFIKEEPNKEFEHILIDPIDDQELNTPEDIKRKTYVNKRKRTVKSKPSVMMENVNTESELSQIIIKKEPQENCSSLMEVDGALSNVDRDIKSEAEIVKIPR